MNVYLQDETDEFIKVSIGNKQLFPIEVYGIYKNNIEIYNKDRKNKTIFVNFDILFCLSYAHFDVKIGILGQK